MEHVVPLDLGVTWAPDVPMPLLLENEFDAYLIVSPFSSDPDSRPVVFRWPSCDGALLGPPNDEARHGHRLWERGLKEVLWAGQVIESEWIARLEEQNRVHRLHDARRLESLRHFILPFHDSTFEVVSRDVDVERISLDAVLERMGASGGASGPAAYKGPGGSP